MRRSTVPASALSEAKRAEPVPPPLASLIGRTRVSAATAMKLASPCRPRDAVHVEVVGLGSAGGGAEVDPDVDGIAGKARLERDHRVLGARRSTAHVLVRVERPEVRNRPAREHHEVARRVGEAVQQREGVHAAPHHPGRFVALLVGAGEDALEQRSPVGVLGRRQRRRSAACPRTRTATSPTGDQAARRSQHLWTTSFAMRTSSCTDLVIALRYLGGQRLGEGVDVDVALGLVGAASVDADGAGLDVGVADHEHIGELVQLGLADPRPQRLVGLGQLGAEAVGPEPVDDAMGVGQVVAPHREHPTCSGASQAGNAPA